MDKDGEWVFVENEDEMIDEFNESSICENNSKENLLQKSPSNYASALLKNVDEQNNQQRTLPKMGQNKEKLSTKRNQTPERPAPYLEAKPGSQYRNPRDKAGKNKVHKGRQRSSSPPRRAGNSLKTGCSFCAPEFSNRAERRRTLRQQRSIVHWKDDDY